MAIHARHWGRRLHKGGARPRTRRHRRQHARPQAQRGETGEEGQRPKNRFDPPTWGLEEGPEEAIGSDKEPNARGRVLDGSAKMPLVPSPSVNVSVCCVEGD